MFFTQHWVNSLEPHYRFDPSEIDTLEDQLAEQFNLTTKQATAIAQWHRQQIANAETKQDSFHLGRLIGYLLRPGNMWLKVISLSFAARLNRQHGFRSQRDAAKAHYGFTVAALNKEVNAWIDLLELPRNEHCKSNASRLKYKAVQSQNHWRRRTF